MADQIDSVIRTGVMQAKEELISVAEVPQTSQKKYMIPESQIAKNIAILQQEIIKTNASVVQAGLQEANANDRASAIANLNDTLNTLQLELAKWQEIQTKLPAAITVDPTPLPG